MVLNRSFRLIMLGTLLSASMVLTGCSAITSLIPQPGPTSQADAVSQNAACLRDLGWTDFELESDGVVFNGQVEQLDPWLEAVQTCSEEVGMPRQRALTDEEYEQAFAAQSSVLACLRVLGYDLPDAPSFQTYVDSKAAWSPYNELDQTVLMNDLSSLEEQCPQATLW